MLTEIWPDAIHERQGGCYDNASAERFFKTIKAELIWGKSWAARRHAETAIFQYINGFYNPRRRHAYPGGISPLAFERKAAYNERPATGTKPL